MIFNETIIDIAGHSAPFRSYVPDAAPECFEKDARPAVIIFPGGGYSFTYAGEAEPIALKLCAEGICVFILDYATAPSGKVFPIALAEALTALKQVRCHAKEYGIDPNNIATLGFSAGGHLCACTGTLWNSHILDPYLQGDREDYRPNKIILCYPVISTDSDIAHKGSFENLFGLSFNDIPKDMTELVSAEKNVGKHTPPTFIWSTATDNAVPIQNSLVMARALADQRVPFELYIYPHGYHGLCTGDHVTRKTPFGSDFECSEWTDKAVKFMYDKHQENK